MSRRLTVLAACAIAIVLTGCQTTGPTAGTAIDDSRVTGAVKSKLVADRPANLTAVGVDTVNGITYLTGLVDTPDQRLRAEQLAWDTSGVRQVVNNIQVQRPSPVVVTPAPAVSASPPASLPRRAMIGTVTSVDPNRSQVTVSTGSEQMLLQLPSNVVRDLRPGDQITLDVNARPVR